MIILTDEHCTGYSQAGHPERPQRITTTVELLKNQTELPLSWMTPSKKISDKLILRAHTPEVLARLMVPMDFDNDTPYFDGIAGHALDSVAASIDALKLALEGKNVFSLMRPPGHHATREHSMGFCYLNNIAIAALEAANTGKRLAIFDFDVHHGNGTEDILRDHENIAFYSVHQFPAYPHSGEKNVGKNCFNYCVAPGAPRETYRETLARALGDLQKFSPQLIGVSAGFDAYARDPLAEGSLFTEDFYWLGKSFREMGTPFFSLLEGGYSRDLPELIFAYLKGVAGR